MSTPEQAPHAIKAPHLSPSRAVTPATTDLASEHLDPDGDVILFVKDKKAGRRFLCSTKILSLASPVFAKLFGPAFREGAQLATAAESASASGSSCPAVITLHGDCAKSMAILLSILHYKEPVLEGKGSRKKMNAEGLALLSIHCDKYQCVQPLRLWIFNQLRMFEDTSGPKELGLLLLTTHFLRAAEQFSSLCQKIITNSPSNFSSHWDKLALMDFLPIAIRDDLCQRREDLLSNIYNEIQSVENLLRYNGDDHAMQTRYCTICDRIMPVEARKCHPCSNTTFFNKRCDADVRVSEYFATLRSWDLWPSVRPFRVLSAGAIADSVTGKSEHSCSGGLGCALYMRLNALVAKVREIVQGAPGLDLYPLH